MKQTRLPVIVAVLVSILLVGGCASNNPSSSRGRAASPSGGLETAAPEDQGMDPSILAGLETHITEEMPHVVSFLIARNGSLVFEYYSNAANRDQAYSVQSVTKSFTGALVGIALDLGYLDSLDQHVIDFFPDLAPAKDASPRLEELTIRDLLTMRAGFAHPVTAGPAPLVADKLQEEMSSEPGSTFAYDNGVSQLLSAILTEATGVTAGEFAGEYLLGPLGIDNVWWAAARDGYSQGDAGLMMTARDMVKFGMLYANGGSWGGEQVVPAEWVRESTTAQSAGGYPEGTAYGYQWWVDTDASPDAFFAAGFGGQYIYVVPDLALVVAVTSQFNRHHVENREVISEFVIPAVME